ncbi:hypothetical protein EON65_08745 [archaeon]|nr:MAG: hypothetical protein EON65_08745 [archaeon]
MQVTPGRRSEIIVKAMIISYIILPISRYGLPLQYGKSDDVLIGLATVKCMQTRDLLPNVESIPTSTLKMQNSVERLYSKVEMRW